MKRKASFRCLIFFRENAYLAVATKARKPVDFDAKCNYYSQGASTYAMQQCDALGFLEGYEGSMDEG
jgi:hypothetical protein